MSSRNMECCHPGSNLAPPRSGMVGRVSYPAPLPGSQTLGLAQSRCNLREPTWFMALPANSRYQNVLILVRYVVRRRGALLTQVALGHHPAPPLHVANRVVHHGVQLHGFERSAVSRLRRIHPRQHLPKHCQHRWGALGGRSVDYTCYSHCVQPCWISILLRASKWMLGP